MKSSRPMRARLTVCSLAATLCAPLTLLAVPATAQDDGETVVLAVEIEASSDRDDVAELADTAATLAEEAGGNVRVDDAAAEVVSVEVPAAQADAVSDQLAEVDAVQSVVEPVEFTLWRAPNDRRFSRQWSYLRPIGVPRAWNRTQGSASTRIAVVDSGIDTRHADLAGKVVGRHNAVYGGRNINDRDKHGTAVASIAAAATNNRKGLAGVGWKTSLLGVKVTDRDGRIWGDALAAGIRWSVRNGADVINLSLGSSQDDSFVRRAVAFAVSRGVVVVSAVSNSGSTAPTYPAAYPGVLSVGATDGRSLASFSDRGAGVDVAAPGVGLLAAVSGGGYTRVDGTSFATALVSGQASLIRAARPAMKGPRVSRIITRTARQVGSGGLSVGRVHVFDSVIRATGAATKPRGLAAVGRTRAAVVTWQPPASVGRAPLSGYQVKVRPVGDTWRTAARVGPSRERVKVRGLNPRRSYVIRVVPRTSEGRGVPARVGPVRPL